MTQHTMLKTRKEEYRRGRRKCVFCEPHGNISKEHLFGLWLRRFFPRDAHSKHKSAYITWGDETGPSAPNEKRLIGQGHVGSKKLRVVCKSCNSGWLSKLETRTQSALPPLIVGMRCNLLEGGQKLLATWAAKTAMIAEYSAPFDSEITQDEREWLKNRLIPPENWFVWISAYQGKDWGNLGLCQVRAGLSRTPIPRPSDAPYYAQATTFGVGHILFCVVSGSSPDMGRFLSLKADGFVRIWPVQAGPILWPPAQIFGDAEAYEVANIFSKSGVFDNSLDPGANWTFTH